MDMCGFTKEALQEKAVIVNWMMTVFPGDVFMDKDGNFVGSEKDAVIVFTKGPMCLQTPDSTVYAVNLVEWRGPMRYYGTPDWVLPNIWK